MQTPDEHGQQCRNEQQQFEEPNVNVHSDGSSARGSVRQGPATLSRLAWAHSPVEPGALDCRWSGTVGRECGRAWLDFNLLLRHGPGRPRFHLSRRRLRTLLSGRV
jgi:hypothetical protein